MKITIEKEQKQTCLFLSGVRSLRNAVMKIRFLSAITITAILFASCGSDDDNIPEVNDGRVLFSSGANVATPKVGGIDGNQWAINDSIGIYMRDNAPGKAIVSENIKYIIRYLIDDFKHAAFYCPDINKIIYYPVNNPEKVDFLAYFPYDASVNDYVYKVDVSDQKDQSALDLMVAHNDNNTKGFDKTNTLTVDLNFEHQLVKLYIEVFSVDEPNLDNLKVTLKRMNTTADFAIDKSELTNEGTQGDIEALRQPNSNKFEAIVLPVELNDNHIIEFTINNNTYKFKMNDIYNNLNNIKSLEKGYNYHYSVRLQKNAVKITGIIDKWLSLGYDTEGIAK